MVFLFLAQVVFWICQVLIVILIARAILSWVVHYGRQYNNPLFRIYHILSAVTEPIVAPVRRLIARFINTGPIDLAPLATFLIIILIRMILTAILLGLARLVM